MELSVVQLMMLLLGKKGKILFYYKKVKKYFLRLGLQNVEKNENTTSEKCF